MSATLEIEFDPNIGQDAYNRLTDLTQDYGASVKIGYNYRNEINNLSFINVNAHVFEIEDFAKSFAIEYVEEIKVTFIPEKNPLRDARFFDIDASGFVMEEKKLGWTD